MARSSTHVRSCPSCLSPLVEIHLGDELTLRSCSGCDMRFWSRLDEATELPEVLAVVSATDRRGRPARPAR
jgi:hypothetical protein